MGAASLLAERRAAIRAVWLAEEGDAVRAMLRELPRDPAADARVAARTVALVPPIALWVRGSDRLDELVDRSLPASTTKAPAAPAPRPSGPTSRSTKMPQRPRGRAPQPPPQPKSVCPFPCFRTRCPPDPYSLCDPAPDRRPQRIYRIL